MDKIRSLHFKACRDSVLCIDASHKNASITEELMGEFAEWKDENGWTYMKSHNVYLNEEGPLTPVTREELINIFKQTL